METKSSKNMIKKSSGKLGKLLGAANLVLGVIPDTVEIVGKITDKAAPIVDKHLERQHEYKQALIPLPNLLDVDIEQAQTYLENLGLRVIPLLAKVDKKYATADAGEVVAMSPRSGKLRPDSLVKLYYVDEWVIEQSKKEVPLPDVTGLALSEAQDLLKDLGYFVSVFPVKPNQKYAHMAVNQVLSMSPNPQFHLSAPKKGSLVKLYYLNAASKQASRVLSREAREKKEADKQAIKGKVEQFQKILSRKK